MKKLFLNCGCNYNGKTYIKDRMNCGIPITYCKQCNKSLTPCGSLSNIELFNTKEKALDYREKLFENPEKTLLKMIIPGPWEGVNETVETLIKENFNLLNN